MPQPLPEGTEKLLEQMDRLVDLMEQDGHTYWNKRVREAAALLRKEDRGGFEHFLSGFGSSGSFNEAVIGKGSWRGGKFAWESGHQALHEEFERLKSESYTLARRLQLDSAPPISEPLATSYTPASSRTRSLLLVLASSLVAFIAYALAR